MKMDFRSIRFRLTAWYAAVMALTMTLFAAGIWFFVRASLVKQLDKHLESELAVVDRFIVENPEEIDELEQHQALLLFDVSKDGQVLRRSKAWSQIGLPDVTEKPAHRSWSWGSGAEQHFRLVTTSVNNEGSTYVITVAEDENPVRSSLGILAITLIVGLPCALGLAVVGGSFLAARALSPIDKMATKARQISADRLQERLPVENPGDELGRLATVFNRTLTCLEDAFDRLRRFTADASHELRTPLTALRSVGEVGLSRGSDPASYRDVIGSMLEEADKLALLVDNLLTLTRIDSGYLKLHVEWADLALLVGEVVDCLRVLAEEKGQNLDVDIRQPVAVRVDCVTLRQAVLNLLDNAIKYTPEHGHIAVMVGETTQGEAYVAVIDDGPGIAVEHQDKVFDRFYRVDQDRSCAQGGTGLGLAIAKHAVELNGSRIELESEQGKGSTFRIVLPLKKGGAAA